MSAIHTVMKDVKVVVFVVKLSHKLLQIPGYPLNYQKVSSLVLFILIWGNR